MTDKKSILSRLNEAVNGTEKVIFTDEELDKFASFYLDKWDENTSEDVVAESFVDYWWNTERACRRCTQCGIPSLCVVLFIRKVTVYYLDHMDFVF